MAKRSEITMGGQSFRALNGELLLDAALSNGVNLPSNCRAGYCGTCRVRLVSGRVRGGAGCEPGIIHACQSQIAGDAVIDWAGPTDVRTVAGMLSSLRALSSNVIEVGITTDRALPYHAGQFAQLRFSGYPSRLFSITHPLEGDPESGSVYFHIRRMKGGGVTSKLGRRIKRGHLVELTGPYGLAHFKPLQNNRLILVATSTGFAPIWAIAVAALRENPERSILVIAGGGSIDALYMAPALVQLARFANVRVVPVCSSPSAANLAVMQGRPTDYLPPLLPGDEIYACGAPPMVAAVKSIAASAGAACHADPFVRNANAAVEDGILTRAWRWLSMPTLRTANQRPRRANHSRSRQPALARAQSESEIGRYHWS